MILKYPVKIKNVSQQFGFDNTEHLISEKFYKLFDNKHSGVDFPVDVGTEVHCSYSGIVVRREFHKGMGNVIGIRNGNIVFLYAHLDRFKVRLGQIVKQGNLVGYSGQTGGACSEPHLHFELRDISKPTLKDMVFEPKFNQELSNLKNTFTYTINNTNTSKSLSSLSKLYFGIEKYWTSIRETNPSLASYLKDQVISDMFRITIPNY